MLGPQRGKVFLLGPQRGKVLTETLYYSIFLVSRIIHFPRYNSLILLSIKSRRSSDTLILLKTSLEYKGL